MWQDQALPIRAQLGVDEKLIWSGQPRRGLTFRASDMFVIPFSLLWCGFAVFWESMVLKGNAPWFFKLWGIPFILVGLYMVIGRFFADAWLRSRTTYGLTNQRVLIVTRSFSQKLVSLSLRNLPPISVTSKSDGSGTITFGETQTGASWFAGTNWQGRSRQPAAPMFELIADVNKVFGLIRTAQNQAG